MSFWTPFNFFFVIGSIAIFFIIHAVIYSDGFGYKYIGTLRVMCSTPNYWLGLLLAVVILLAPVVALKFWALETRPTLSDKLRLKASIHRSKSFAKHKEFRPRTSIRRELRSQSIRSGYAFAHEGGFGELITSGRYLRRGEQSPQKQTTAHDVST